MTGRRSVTASLHGLLQRDVLHQHDVQQRYTTPEFLPRLMGSYFCNVLSDVSPRSDTSGNFIMFIQSETSCVNKEKSPVNSCKLVRGGEGEKQGGLGGTRGEVVGAARQRPPHSLHAETLPVINADSSTKGHLDGED